MERLTQRVHTLGDQPSEKRHGPLHPETRRVHGAPDSQQLSAVRRCVRAFQWKWYDSHRLRGIESSLPRDRALPRVCRHGGAQVVPVHRIAGTPRERLIYFSRVAMKKPVYRKSRSKVVVPVKKNGRPRKKNPGGRPPKIQGEVLDKLFNAFTYGMTDEQACLYAEIDLSTLYKYCQKNPKFADRKEALKQMPVIHAKKNVVSSIMKGDTELSKWLLDRRDPDFKNRGALEVKHTLDPM